MATKQDDRRQDPYRAGYDQPGDPRANTVPSPGYALPYPGGQASAYPVTETNTDVIICQPSSITLVEHRQQPLTDWTVPAILVTIFCFCPTGICAIIAANQARYSYHSGDFQGERSATNWAKGLTISSIIIAVLIATIFVILETTYFAQQRKIYNAFNYNN